MCGIVGNFGYKGVPISAEEILAIRDAMCSRGPDGYGLYVTEDERVALGHRRLSIIDLSEAGAQPMRTQDNNLAITFNGEIYNYPELRRGLEAKGYKFRSNCDTEVLLHLYHAKGAEMLKDLRGMYAFGLWDARKRGLLLACDPFGMKPLYYADNGKTLRFASQVKALLQSKKIDTTPDPAGHVGFFLWGSVPQPHTLYRGIRALAAGTSLWIDEEGVRSPHTFCSISHEISLAARGALESSRGETQTAKNLQEQLGEALRDSLKHHLLADVPISLFLSAGLDSATLTALASEVARDQLDTITLAFDEYAGSPRDEAPQAEQLAALYGTRQHTMRVRGSDFRQDIEHLFSAMDQPTIDGVNSFFVSKVAAQTGAKVALSGLGGDELFGGYPSFSQIPQVVRRLSPMRYMPFNDLIGRGFRTVSAGFLKRRTSPKYASILEYGNTYGGAYLLRRGLFMPWELPELLDVDLVRQGWNDLQPLLSLQQTTKGISKSHLKVTALEMSWYMRNQLLRDTDWASMAHSLEVRTPLVDLPLLRAVAALVAHQRVSKVDMALTPQKPLPLEILNRKKTGFSVPVALWLGGDMASEFGSSHTVSTGDLHREWSQWAKVVYSRFAPGSLLT